MSGSEELRKIIRRETGFAAVNDLDVQQEADLIFDALLPLILAREQAAREECAAAVRSVIDEQDTFVNNATPYTRRDLLMDAAAYKMGAEKALGAIRALPTTQESSPAPVEEKS